MLLSWSQRSERVVRRAEVASRHNNTARQHVAEASTRTRSGGCTLEGGLVTGPIHWTLEHVWDRLGLCTLASSGGCRGQTLDSVWCGWAEGSTTGPFQHTALGASLSRPSQPTPPHNLHSRPPVSPFIDARGKKDPRGSDAARCASGARADRTPDRTIGPERLQSCALPAELCLLDVESLASARAAWGLPCRGAGCSACW